MWHVYKHTNIYNDKVYIGMTSKDNPVRRWGKQGNGYFQHNPHFTAAIKKYGWDSGFKHEVLFSFETMEEAEEKEIELISFYDATNPKYGYNVLAGGNCSNHSSEETRRKQSEAHKGFHHSEETKQLLREINLGSKRSEEARRHMSESAKKRKRHPMSQETKDKISAKHKGKKLSQEQIDLLRLCNSITVSQYDLNGKFIQTFPSAKEAERRLGLKSTHINECCRSEGKTKPKSSNGYQWRYRDDGKDIGSVDEFHRPTKVGQYDEKDGLICVYENATEAARAIDGDGSAIRKCCKGKLKFHRGYKWKIVE